jgi:hypothetical protein
VLDELLEAVGEPGRDLLNQHAGAMVQRMIANYTSEDTTDTALARSWGVMPPASYQRIAVQCAEEVIRPRFAARGITA